MFKNTKEDWILLFGCLAFKDTVSKGFKAKIDNYLGEYEEWFGRSFLERQRLEEKVFKDMKEAGNCDGEGI